MIVSMAIDVLPVLRSPMISSRWPRPMGVMASMTLMPVCSGSLTGWRSTMPGAWISMRRMVSAGDRPLAVDGLAQGVDDPAEEPVADGDRQDAPGGADRLAFLDVRRIAEDDGADRVLVEVEGEAEQAPVELEELVDHGVGQSRHAGDAITDLGDVADLLGLEGRREAVQALAEGGGDVVGSNRQVGHGRVLLKAGGRATGTREAGQDGGECCRLSRYRRYGRPLPR